jgi:hypothetical protein
MTASATGQDADRPAVPEPAEVAAPAYVWTQDSRIVRNGSPLEPLR